MSKAQLINERENERDYKINNGEIITLKLSHDLTEISFIVNGKELSDGFAFVDLDGNGYKVIRMYIPEYEHCGLGRAALEFFKEITEEKLYASFPDGFKRNDGSHLTGDAPGFVSKMIDEGIIDGYDEAGWYKDSIEDI